MKPSGQLLHPTFIHADTPTLNCVALLLDNSWCISFIIVVEQPPKIPQIPTNSQTSRRSIGTLLRVTPCSATAVCKHGLVKLQSLTRWTLLLKRPWLLSQLPTYSLQYPTYRHHDADVLRTPHGPAISLPGRVQNSTPQHFCQTTLGTSSDPKQQKKRSRWMPFIGQLLLPRRLSLEQECNLHHQSPRQP